MVVMDLPNTNDGKLMPAQVGAGGGFIPKGAEARVDIAKDFMKKILHAATGDERDLKAASVPLGPRNSVDRAQTHGGQTPKSDPHRLPYVTEAVLNPTVTSYNEVEIRPGAGQRRAALGARRTLM